MSNPEEYSDDNILSQVPNSNLKELNAFAFSTARLIDDIEKQVVWAIDPTAQTDLRHKLALHRRTLGIIQKRRGELS